MQKNERLCPSVPGDDSGAGSLDHLGELLVEPELVLGDGPDDVHVVLPRKVVHLADARVVCNAFEGRFDNYPTQDPTFKIRNTMRRAIDLHRTPEDISTI